MAIFNFDSIDYTLATNEVIVWMTTVFHKFTDTDLDMTLTNDEQKQSQKFRFSKDKYRYLTTRYVIRHLMARYLDKNAADIIFETQQHGKPFIPDSDLYFNISHSEDIIVIAISKTPDLGIDIEFKREMSDLQDLFDICTNTTEKSQFSQQRNSSFFYRLWTTKEAALKAVGIGLNISMADIGVASQQNSLTLLQSPLYKQPLSVHEIAIDDAYQCALVMPENYFPSLKVLTCVDIER